MNMKKLVALLLALVMVVSLAACNGNVEPTGTTPKDTTPKDTEGTEPVVWSDPYADLADDYDALSQAIYADVLGEFYEYYEVARACQNVSERYALMAIAEAKLLQAGIMLPLQASGGNYAISRVAPGTANNSNWGNDADRYHNLLIATEPLTPAQRDTMKAKYAELKGTGTYMEWAKSYLEGEGMTLKDSYTLGYSSNPKTWDDLASSRSADHEALVNTYDNLMEYDNEGIQQYALAESHTVSADGLTYTFKLKQGLKWVDSQGREVADLKADDFVASMQHLLDVGGGLESLLYGIIVNAQEYVAGDVTDFAEVGVKAVDDYTVEYTLAAPCSYFMTMLTYSMFVPLSREYYVSQGGTFGDEFDSSAETYKYGTSPDNIAYCGPYLITNFTADNTIVFDANPSYWNADGISIKKITWLFNDGTDATKAYNDCIAGVLDGAGLNASALEAAKADGNFEKYAYISTPDTTAYVGFFNVNRTALANFDDEVSAASTKDEEMVERAKGAMYNVHFRRAIMHSLDRGAYMAQSVGEDLKYASMINSYVPGDFVFLAEDVTVDINGTPTTFAAGTFYGAIMQAQMDADGVALKVWDPTLEGGMGSSKTFDGWYDVEAAKAELAIAIEELAAQGLEISAENPIYLDLPAFSGSETYLNRANAFKQSIEAALGGCVILNLVECPTSAEWYSATYYPEYGYQSNYDINDVTGWGPDWGDPNTYLDTMLPDYAGYMTKNLGIF